MGNNHSYLQKKIITISFFIDLTFIIAYLVPDLILGARGHNVEQAIWQLFEVYILARGER